MSNAAYAAYTSVTIIPNHVWSARHFTKALWNLEIWLIRSSIVVVGGGVTVWSYNARKEYMSFESLTAVFYPQYTPSVADPTT